MDAAEIDRDIISARLQQDVMEHAGKVHLFVADSVRVLFLSSPTILITLYCTSSMTLTLLPHSAYEATNWP